MEDNDEVCEARKNTSSILLLTGRGGVSREEEKEKEDGQGYRRRWRKEEEEKQIEKIRNYKY